MKVPTFIVGGDAADMTVRLNRNPLNSRLVNWVTPHPTPPPPRVRETCV